MGSKERREREREEIRGKILEAARRMFVAEGVEAVTMRRIADEIEYSPTAIYLHFRDKDALLVELCSTDFRALAKEFGSLAKIADPVERLRRIGRAYAAFAASHPQHYRLMFMTPKPEIRPEDTGIDKGNPEQDAYAFLRVTIEEGIAAGRFRAEHRDSELLAQLLWAAVHGVVSLEIAKGHDAFVEWRPLAVRVTAMIDTLVDALTVEERTGHRPAPTTSRKQALGMAGRRVAPGSKSRRKDELAERPIAAKGARRG